MLWEDKKQMRTVCKFSFKKSIKRKWIETHIMWAIFNAECIFGKPKVRTGFSYYVSDDKPQCVFDISTDVGEHIARLFTGMMIKELGETGFEVKRIDRDDLRK